MGTFYMIIVQYQNQEVNIDTYAWKFYVIVFLTCEFFCLFALLSPPFLSLFIFGSTGSPLQYTGSLVLACRLLAAAWGIQFPHQGLNLGPLHWERGVLLTRPPGKSQILCHFITSVDSGNHHDNQDTELFHHQEDLPCATSLESHPPPFSYHP